MNSRANAVFAILLGAGLVVFGAYLTFLRGQHAIPYGPNHRLTATIAVDGRMVTASRVYAINCQGPQLAEGVDGNAPCAGEGEAIAMDLGRRGKLFILMIDQNLQGYDFLAHGLLMAEKNGRAVPMGGLPLMVKFTDTATPDSVEAVDPDHLDASFGPGVSFKELTVTNTVEPVSPMRLAADLPWLWSLNGRALAPPESGNRLASRLHASDFSYSH